MCRPNEAGNPEFSTQTTKLIVWRRRGLPTLVDISLLRASFAVVPAFSNHPESQSLCLRNRDLLALPISQHARQLQDLG